MRSSQSFVKGAIILTVAAAVSRALGAIYSIILPRVIGPDGFGLFQMAYPVYNIIFFLAAGGLNVAISKLVAEKLTLGDRWGALRVFRTSLFVLALLGLVSSLGLYLGANFVAVEIMGDPLAAPSIAAISPAIFFVAVMAAFRGFFQGMQRMEPTAQSQVLEQIMRVSTMFVLAYLLLPRGVEMAAAGAAFGAVTGAVAGLFFLIFLFARERVRWRRTAPRSRRGSGEDLMELVKRLAALAIPISLAGIILPIIQFADAAIVPSQLQVAGHPVEEARALFGFLAMGFKVVFMPTIVTAALSMSLVPAVSEANALGHMSIVRSRSMAGLRLTFLFALPAVVGLYLLADDIATLLWPQFPEAGGPIAWLSAGLLFISVQQTSSGILQGLGRPVIPARNLFIGALVKVLLTLVLVPRPAFGAMGAALATVLGFLVASSLNVASLHLLVGLRPNLGLLVVKPAVAIATMGVAVRLIQSSFTGFPLPHEVVTLAAVFGGAVVYGLTLLLVGGLTVQDLHLIPRIGPRVAAILERAGLVSRD